MKNNVFLKILVLIFLWVAVVYGVYFHVGLLQDIEKDYALLDSECYSYYENTYCEESFGTEYEGIEWDYDTWTKPDIWFSPTQYQCMAIESWSRVNDIDNYDDNETFKVFHNLQTGEILATSHNLCDQSQSDCLDDQEFDDIVGPYKTIGYSLAN